MKRTGDDRSRIELFLGKNSSDFDRMREVRIPRLPLLAAVGPHGKDVGAIQACFVGALIVAAHPLDEFVLPHHAGLSCRHRSEEHTSELQSLMRISYAVFCLKKTTHTKTSNTRNTPH